MMSSASTGSILGCVSAPSVKPKTIVTCAPVVFVVDDDVSVRESLEVLIDEAGWKPEVFGSAEEFLDSPRLLAPSCLILDVGLPDLNGLEVQRRIAGRSELPTIFITGHGDIPMSVRAIKAGAVDFLTKPFGPAELLRAIGDALELSRVCLAREADVQALRLRHGSLTPRERQVMALVVLGHLNKQVGGELGICEMTVKVHRGQVMRKMVAKSLAELVSMAASLEYAIAGKKPSASG